MANEDLKVITKAKQLAKHTLIVRPNDNDWIWKSILWTIQR